MYRSRFVGAQVKLLQEYIPSITASEVTRGPAGIRAQAMDDQGNLLDDFVFESTAQNLLHVRNAPSPGATSSLAIAKVISNKAKEMFQLT